jgi:hypothetical protein
MSGSNLPWVESPFFKEILEEKKISVEDKKIAADYHRDGFVVLPGIIPEDLIEAVKKDMNEKGFNPDFPITTQRDLVRVQDLWEVSDPVKQLAVYEPVTKKLEMLYDREVIPFQTLNFLHGSGQRAHSDTIHFSSLPARYMCGVWVALEDITEENGPLFYYPGSHRLTEYNFSHIDSIPGTSSYEKYIDYENFMQKIISVNNFEKKVFLAKKGDALIWSSNILHGGSPVLKKESTRFSQVTHYFFKDCFYYTPMMSNMVTNELFIRNHLRNIRNSELVKQNYNGKEIQQFKTEGDLRIISEKPPKVKRKWFGK